MTRMDMYGQNHPHVYLLHQLFSTYEGWNFNSGNYLFTTDTK